MSDAGSPRAVYEPFPSFEEWNLGDLDATAFDRYAKLLMDSKAAATTENLDRAMTAAMRYAAIDTGAIEGLYTVDRGFTKTIATQAVAWESVIAARGAHVRAAFDDALSGYEYVLDAATKTVEVSELWIRELHQIICASQKTYTVYTDLGPQERPLPKGSYKTIPNSPTMADGRTHAYAPVADTAPEMGRLISELRSDVFVNAHPVAQAAYAHYAYVCVHPFADGNGRVARAIASVYLYRLPGVPLIVFADQRSEYLDALESADHGDPFAFVEFVMSRTIDAIGIIRSSLQRTAPPMASTLAGLQKLFDSGALDEELRAAGARLAELAASEASKQLKALVLPADLKIIAARGEVSAPNAPDGYVGVGRQGYCYLHASSSWPVRLNVYQGFGAFAKESPSAASELLLTASTVGNGLEVWLRELVPVEHEPLKLKLASWVEGKLEEFLALVASRAERRR